MPPKTQTRQGGTVLGEPDSTTIATGCYWLSQPVPSPYQCPTVLTFRSRLLQCTSPLIEIRNRDIGPGLISYLKKGASSAPNPV